MLKKLATAAVLTLGFTTPAEAGIDHVQSAHVFVVERTTKIDGARGHHAATPVTLEGGVLAYAPPAAPTNDTAVIYLHGAHGLADKGCPWMRSGASDVGWLVCPEAIRKDEGGTWSWGGDVPAQGIVVNRALATVHAHGAASGPAVAVGFSQGSYVALDLVKTRQVHFRGLVLLGAEMHPRAERLCEGGVKRVVLGAGQLDAAYASMKDEADVLAASSCLEARFVDLGRVGHTYAAENTDGLRDAIVWAAG